MTKFSQSKSLKATKLTKEDLINFISLIKQDFPKSEREEDFQIRSNLPALSITENNLETFLSNTKLPKIFNRLSIDQIGWGEQLEIDKKVSVTFYDNYINLNVSGSSESWVLGKYSQLVSFLDGKRTTFWFLKTAPIFMIQGILFIAPLYLLGAIILLYIKHESSKIGIQLPIAILTCLALNSLINKVPFSEIVLIEEKSFFEKHLNKLIILASVATILQLIISVIAFLHTGS